MAVKPDEGKPGRPPTDPSFESLPPLELEDPDSWLLSSDTEDEDAPSIQPRAPARPLPGAFATSYLDHETDMSPGMPGRDEPHAPSRPDSYKTAPLSARPVAQDRTSKDDAAILGHSFPSVSSTGKREDGHSPTDGQDEPTSSAGIGRMSRRPAADPGSPRSSPSDGRDDEIHLHLIRPPSAPRSQEPTVSDIAKPDGRVAERPGQRMDAPRSPGTPLSTSQPSMKVQHPSATPPQDSRFTPEFIEEIRSMFSYLDRLLESLPDERIEEFARSPYFESYRKIFEILRLV